jgi:hypothetical protein
MTSFAIEAASNRKMKHSMSNVNVIIDAAKTLFSEKYPHIINDNIANISYEECGGNISFSDITFESWNGESIVITDRRVYLNAADGVQYILLEYENDIEDICYYTKDDIKKEPNGPTNVARLKEKAQESLYNHLMCALGTMLPISTVMSMNPEQVDESAKKIAQYLISNGYVKEDYV